MEAQTAEHIAILMTVHNRREKTLACLRNISGMTYDRDKYALEVYMTDDGCTDGTAEAVLEEFPDTHIIRGNGELFWNRGMYAAWQEASKRDFDYYWWVNDDTFVFQDTLSRMLACSAKHSDSSITVGCTISSDGSGTVTYGGFIKSKLIADITISHKCETLNGNLVLIPREVFSKLGANDPYYRHALGDMDYGLRATENGIGIWTVPGACGICDLHEHITTWMDPQIAIKQRWNNFFSPLGNNPFEFFHYTKAHYGIMRAIALFISNFCHFLFPGLWIKKVKADMQRKRVDAFR